jgi:hypothetical protein
MSISLAALAPRPVLVAIIAMAAAGVDYAARNGQPTAQSALL